MKTDRLSGRFLKQLVFWTFALILPALRIASALELHPSGSDVVHLDIAELDAIARVSLAGEQGYYYGLVFWEEFFVTVLPGPESAETGTEYLSQLQEQLSVTPLNVPGSISASGVRSLRYQDVGQSKALVIGRLNQRFTGHRCHPALSGSSIFLYTMAWEQKARCHQCGNKRQKSITTVASGF